MANTNSNIVVRGDDDVFDLLNEMSHTAADSSRGGKGSFAAPKTNGVSSVSSTTTCPPSSLFPTIAMEGTGRHCTENDNIVTKLPGKMMTTQLLSLGCNPHVEIIRHRQHEKFKASFYDLFRPQCLTTFNSNNNINTNNSDKNGSSNNVAVRNFNQKQQQQHIIRATIATVWNSVRPHIVLQDIMTNR